jgi:hypothetical protein
MPANKLCGVHPYPADYFTFFDHPIPIIAWLDAIGVNHRKSHVTTFGEDAGRKSHRNTFIKKHYISFRDADTSFLLCLLHQERLRAKVNIKSSRDGLDDVPIWIVATDHWRPLLLHQQHSIIGCVIKQTSHRIRGSHDLDKPTSLIFPLLKGQKTLIGCIDMLQSELLFVC